MAGQDHQCAHHGKDHAHHHAPPADAGTVKDSADSAQVKDPVCGMTVDVATSKHNFEHDGTTYHFCCGGCALAFRIAGGSEGHGGGAGLLVAVGVGAFLAMNVVTWVLWLIQDTV